MTLLQGSILFVAALLAGALNSVAGGGSFLALPALIFTGVHPLAAAITSTVALWPGSVASIGAYWGELSKSRRALLIPVIMGIVGGVIGSVLLLRTSPDFFERLLPYLVLAATLLFAFGKKLTSWITSRFRRSEPRPGERSRGSLVIGALVLLAISTYGGFFGGGMGILILATLTIMGMENIHTMNANKVLLATFIKGVAVLSFAIAGAVIWPKALLMIVGAIIGGYAGGYFAQKLDPKVVRRFVIVLGFCLTVYFFIGDY